MRAFKIKEVKPRIFLFEFKNAYDMCIHFLRYQEYYESASPKFRGKPFAIFDFMKWYSEKYGKGAFTYTIDWSGFNLPGHIISDLQDLIPDPNQYDEEMNNAHKECKAKSGGKPFYIIGTTKGSNSLNHEIAHGLFFLDPSYRKIMTGLVKELSPKLRKKINLGLKSIGYTPKVYVDETQAYLSTGSGFAKTCKEEVSSKFKKVFENFMRK